MPGLAFDALDHHVVLGRGDEVCVITPERSVTFIDFLTHTAALAGGLSRLGIGNGNGLDLRLPAGWDRLSLLFALLRLGLTPAAGAKFHASDSPTVLSLETEIIDLTTVMKIGKTDPAPAPVDTDSHLLAELIDSDRDWYSALLAGQIITLK